MTNRKTWVGFGLITLIAFALWFAPYSWVGWQPASCMPHHCFCEALRDGFIRQPINTYSNLAYILVGWFMLSIAQDDWRRGARANLMQNQRALPLLFGAATILIGAGSFFYHASFTFVGQWFDVMGMYLFATFALIYTYARLRPIRVTTFGLMYGVANIALGYLLIVNPAVRRQTFTALVYGIIALEALVLLVERPRVRTRFFSAALASMAMGYAIWMLDESGAWCDPHSLAQGHALWHGFTALAAGALYLYYRSENGKVEAR